VLDHCWVALDARMGELYAAEYRRDLDGPWGRPWCRIGEERLISPGALQAHLRVTEDLRLSLAGSGFEAYPEPFSSRTQRGVVLDAEAVAALAQAASKEQWVEAEQLAPTYLRNNIAETLAQRQAKKAKSKAAKP
jgi:tRNA threonylcarbamoyladenosine biosynthesis protein TsaB